MSKLPVHLDMETQDPDDVFTLCLLATHPRADLRGVTVFPGGRDQVGLIKHVLQRLDKASIPVGAQILDDGKSRVSSFHYRWLGQIPACDPDDSASKVIHRNLDCTLLTGAPLRNLRRAYQEPFFTDWTCQGGFAGESLVSEPLEKFRGRETCPTFNLNGDVEGAKLLLQSASFKSIRMVSKNVCHGVIFSQGRAEKMPRGAHPGLDLLLDGMKVYFEHKPDGKALHDVIAAALTLDPESATWAWGHPYRKKGEWGFKAEHGTNCRITVALDHDRMYESWAA